jgi:hypothetical protein
VDSQTIAYIAILVLGTASYAVGIKQVIDDTYSPSIFSRCVWLLLAINSFAGVLLSSGSGAAILLAGVLLAGNAAMCLVSFWKGNKDFGRLELFCIGLLVISGLLWILVDAPLVNLGISLFAHLVGAIPTYRKVWSNPETESTPFWSLFLAASIISIFASEDFNLTTIIFPLYYTLFDGSMFILSIRRKRPKK